MAYSVLPNPAMKRYVVCALAAIALALNAQAAPKDKDKDKPPKDKDNGAVYSVPDTAAPHCF